MCEGTAAVDVSDEQHGRGGRERDAHVGEIRVVEVDLGWTARALDHDELELVQKRMQRALDRRPE